MDIMQLWWHSLQNWNTPTNHKKIGHSLPLIQEGMSSQVRDLALQFLREKNLLERLETWTILDTNHFEKSGVFLSNSIWNWASSVHLITGTWLIFCICAPTVALWINLHPDSHPFCYWWTTQYMKDDPVCRFTTVVPPCIQNICHSNYENLVILDSFGWFQWESMRFPTNALMLEIHFRTPNGLFQ